jgi:hypothetical protein
MFAKNNRSVSVRLVLVLILIAGVYGVTLVKADTAIRYVKWDATGANNGSSWTDAYTDLQSALSAASSGDEIWVAAGTYKPTSGADRTVSFALKNGVAVYGGFAGGETQRDQRNFQTNITILSGDIGVEGNNSDNSYHVVVGSHTDNSAVLDGFTITAGNADDGVGLSEFNKGGGMYNHNGSPTLTKLVFTGNYATFGGGICNSGTISEFWTGSNPVMTDVSFSNNSAIEGGGMRNQYYSSPSLTNITFDGNTAIRSGGGMENFDYSSPVLTNVTFSNNATEVGGGGIMNWNNSNPSLTNVTFHGNIATSNDWGSMGGGIANYLSNPNLLNVTFSGNTADYGGGIYNDYGGNVTVLNGIFEGNSGGEIFSVSGAANITYSIVQGGHPGTGNLDADPLLGPLQNNGGFTQTMALLPGSPAIDAGDDANCPATDQRGVTRPQGSRCDIGAYEYIPVSTPTASLTPTSTPTPTITFTPTITPTITKTSKPGKPPAPTKTPGPTRTPVPTKTPRK